MFQGASSVLVYEVDSQWGKVYILRVLHTAQKWP
ncbi:hypothetical protein CRJUMX02_2290004 [Escherichia coli]|nr:hypothetical protein CRJUMX02_2290004 [Escherichia coli]